MKYFLPLLLATLFLASGCDENETCYEEKGLFTLEEYFEQNPDLDLTQFEDTEMYYTITVPGGAVKPVPTADIIIAYVGEHVTGEVFDQRSVAAPLDINLSRLITGWQLGLPLIGAGGKITLYIPSELAYGRQSRGADICANSDLIFDMELISFSQ